MTAVFGFATVIISVVFILRRIMGPIPAFILVPAVISLTAGYGWQTGDFILKGMRAVAPIGIMFIFATLFFGVIISAGTLRPIVRFIFHAVGHDPVRICIGTGILALLAEMSASGVVTVMVVIPAMLPLFDGLGMRRTTLATVLSLSAGFQCTQPWGSTAQRCMVALNLTSHELWVPIIIPLAVGLLSIFCIDCYLGHCERKRIGLARLAEPIQLKPTVDEIKMAEYERPKLAKFNMLLVVVTIGVLISGMVHAAVVFMISLAIALVVNYPRVTEQKFMLAYHSHSALTMAGIVFATGSLVGVMNCTGMIQAMAEALVMIIPAVLGPHMAVIVGIFAMPATLLFDPSSFYFGVLPVLAEAGTTYGIMPVEMARAAFFGQMNMGFPVSPLTGTTFMLVAMAKLDLAEHQRRTIPWAFAVTIIMLVTALVCGVVPA